MRSWVLPTIAIAGALLGALAVFSYDRLIAPGAADQARIERVVHDYVLANPEIIPEAMQRLQQRTNGQAVAANRADIVQPFAGAWAGNPKGDVTVVEYFDYNCGYCKASLPIVADLLKQDPNIRIVYRDFPILAPSSREAARASLAAARQNRYRAFHDALYAAGPVSADTIAASAEATGVDLAQVNDKAIDAEIARNMETAAKLGLTGTPSWVIGDRVLSGAMPLEELRKAVTEARKG